jgi:hypothetical protein
MEFGKMNYLNFQWPASRRLIKAICARLSVCNTYLFNYNMPRHRNPLRGYNVVVSSSSSESETETESESVSDQQDSDSNSDGDDNESRNPSRRNGMVRVCVLAPSISPFA